MLPTLETARLWLRPFTLDDAPAVERFVSDYEVARNTLRIPHPYPPGGAETWIRSHLANEGSGMEFAFAIVRKETNELIGSVGLSIVRAHARGEVGYWIGRPYWGQGYATEAVRAVLRFGFEQEGLERIFGEHFARNPASGRVLEKAGLRREGYFPRHLLKWDEFQDVVVYGVVRSDWKQQQARAVGENIAGERE